MSELLNEDVLIEEDQHFVVDDDQKAEWCLKKIREAEEEKAKWKAFYDDRYDKICKAEDAKIEQMQYFLHQYFRNIPHKITKTQESYALPSGKLVLKKQGIEWVHDDAQLLPWVKKNAQNMVKVKESVDWAGLKKMISTDDYVQSSGGIVSVSDGEYIPGITVTERPDVFKVEVKE